MRLVALCWVAKQMICVGKNRKRIVSRLLLRVPFPCALHASAIQACVDKGLWRQHSGSTSFVMIMLAKARGMRQNCIVMF